MSATPIIPEQREGERRREWHTPQDCYKLLATQEMVAGLQDSVTGINKRLDDGHARMCKIEDTIFANHLDAVAGRKHMETLLQKNTDVTDEIREILEGSKSFFRAVAKVGSWTRTVVLWVLPLATAVLSFWYVITGQSHK
jgi:hypothetical protein